MSYLANLGRGGGHHHGGGGGGWRRGGGWGGYGGWGYPYEAQVWDPDYCYDVKGNVIPCPVVLPKPVNGLGEITLPGLGKVTPALALGLIALGAFAWHKFKHGGPLGGG